jgi:phosphoserine phosphatase
MIKLDKKIILIDLDGTFVSVNTFHKWMKFLFVEAFKKFQLLSVINILTIIALRYTKRIDHATMKYRILEISEERITQEQIRQFVDTLAPYVNQKLLHIVQDCTTTTILATAAPLLYAEGIKEKYHFNFVVATTNTTASPWQENIRDIKAKNIKNLFDEKNLDTKDAILYTDHHDDIPLMKVVSSTYLINASEKTKNLLADTHLNVVIVDEKA